MLKVVARLKDQTEKLDKDLHESMLTSGKVGEKGKKMERNKSARKFRLSNNK